MVVHILAKSGWYGGNPDTVYEAQGDGVLKAFQYEMFTRHYENAIAVLNRPDNRIRK